MRQTRLLLLFTLCLLSIFAGWAQNKVAPMTAGKVFAKIGDTEATAPVKLTNYGESEVKSIEYTLCYMDTQNCDGPFKMDFDTPLADGETRLVNIPIKAGSTYGMVDVVFHITTVNNSYNETSVPFTYITRCTVNKLPHKRVLLEDYTALWCQWCPVGMVATEALVREHPDDAVAIAIHKGDKLASATAYQNGMLADYAPTLPSLWCARKSKIAGYDGTSMFENEKSEVTYMNIDVEACWNKTGNNINVTTKVEPCMTPDAGNTYAIGYVLTASGLKNDKWLQQANYSDYMSDNYKDAPPEMDFFRDPSNYVGDNYYVKGYTFNHVAIESQGIRYGIANSLTGDFVPNEIKTHTTTFNNINQYNLIQDRNKLEVVAILFDTKNDRIENVAKCHITVPEQEFTMNFDVCDWATLYTDRPYIVPQGVATYQISAQGDVEMVTDGTGANVSIAANTPMLLKGQKGNTYTFKYTDTSNTIVNTALRGSIQDERTTTGNTALTDNDVYYYKLVYDDSRAQAGFYWAEENGAPFDNKAGKCYLVLPRKTVSAARLQGFELDDATVTSIKQIGTTTPATHHTFEVNGRKVQNATAPGLYIVNGKKTAVK